jgi:hypothetical protein
MEARRITVGANVAVHPSVIGDGGTPDLGMYFGYQVARVDSANGDLHIVCDASCKGHGFAKRTTWVVRLSDENKTWRLIDKG